MYVPNDWSGAASGQQEVVRDVVVLLTSAASLMVLVLASLVCGMCYCFGGSKPDYDDDETGFRNSDQEQKWPILNRTQSNGERSSSKFGARRQSPVFAQSNMSHGDENSATIPLDLSKRSDTAAKKTVMFRSVSADPSTIPLQSFHGSHDIGAMRSEPVQPPSVPSLLHVHSQPVMPSESDFERPKPRVGFEHVQPDPSKLATPASNGQAEALGVAQSVDEDNVPSGENLGLIQFSLMYDFPDQTLILRIVKAKQLPAKDFSGTSDPFVKIMLLPDKKVKMETKVKRKNLSPIWNESFHFEGYPYAKIQERVLHLQVLDYDRFSRNDPIGEVNLPLAEVDLTHERLYWRPLTPSKKSSGKLGSLLVSLCYAPTAGRITISVLKCANLAAKDITGKSDPYVKIWHMHKDKRIEKKKTVVKYHTLNPVYNESFVFNIPLDRIRDTTFVVSVVDKDRLSKNDMIGGILLGARASPSEMSHWNEMMSKPRTNIAKWHVLKGMS
ncbi:synaptotagmin-7-like isoform X1 [Diadema antillarum]|uniref:synaptotagmin-7-like isoform X1 n=1 Tax=Diadema antillarum TaxID=105358 RepID=UPI003A83AEF7